MRNRLLRTFAFLLFALCHLPAQAQYPANIKPERLRAEVARMLEAPRPEKADVVFAGSSTIRGWASLSSDLPGLDLIRNGVAGLTLPDLQYYLNELVLRWQPSTIVIYAGDNDIGMYGATAAQVRDAYSSLTQAIHAQRPGCRIFYLSIKPSPKRNKKWPLMQEANALIAAQADPAQALYFVDVSAGMLSADGLPRAELYAADGLHMNRRGYAEWVAPIRSALEAHSGMLIRSE